MKMKMKVQKGFRLLCPLCEKKFLSQYPADPLMPPNTGVCAQCVDKFLTFPTPKGGCGEQKR